jgi:tRNA nucleotidyltransferase (CCA-adding enzyme)
VFCLCLFSDLEDSAVWQVVQRLGMPPRDEEFFGAERAAAHRTMDKIDWRSMQQKPLEDSQVYFLLKALPVEILLYGMARTEHEATRRVISRFITHLRQVDCFLGGRDLQALGLAPGPVYRQIFDQLVTARLEGKVTTREDELRFVKKRFPESAADR